MFVKIANNNYLILLTRSKMKYPTDDVCFLCKDGGDLLECDYVHRDLPVRRPCQRVYHRHCLPFVVPSKSKNWKCPRHYCDFCGNSRVRYMCKYCPMSACAACSKPGSDKVRIVQYSSTSDPYESAIIGLHTEHS